MWALDLDRLTVPIGKRSQGEIPAGGHRVAQPVRHRVRVTQWRCNGRSAAELRSRPRARPDPDGVVIRTSSTPAKDRTMVSLAQ